MSARISCLALVLAGCGSADGLVVITVGAQPALSGLAKLHATASASGTNSSFDVPLSSPAIPPEISFGVQVPARLAGAFSITLDAVDGNGATIAETMGQSQVSAGKRSDLPLSFGSAPTDGGTDGPPPDLSGVTIPTPRLIAPQNTARTTGGRPTLRWSLPAGLSNPQVDVCTKRDCSTMSAVKPTVAASGDRANFATDLPRGVVFWRVRADSSAGPVVSATWQFWVTVVGPNTDGAWDHVLDLDGNGIADAASAGSNEVFVYSGGGGGVATTPVAVVFSPDGTSSDFGTGSYHGVISAGDVDGDGFGDLAVTSDSTGGPKVFIFRGSASGVKTTPAWSFGPFAPTETTSGLFAGDFDRDGYADVGVILRSTVQDGGTPPYHLEIRAGSANGPMATGPSLAHAGIGATAATGDIDGDGYSDLVAADPSTDSAVYFMGSPSGLINPVIIPNPETTTGNAFGNEITLGDFRGQGYCQVAIAAYGYASFVGRVYFYWLPLSTTPNSHIDGTDPPNLGEFGASLIAPGDVDGDGLIDLVVGASGAENKAYLFAGNLNFPAAPAKATITSTLANGNFGQVAGTHGDLDGDGFDDFGLGSPNVMNSQGALVVWYGNSGAFAGRHTDLIGPNANGNFGSAISDMIVRPHRREMPLGPLYGQDRRQGRTRAQPQEHRRRASAQ
jgi:hypothetical protein